MGTKTESGVVLMKQIEGVNSCLNLFHQKNQILPLRPSHFNLNACMHTGILERDNCQSICKKYWKPLRGVGGTAGSWVTC